MSRRLSRRFSSLRSASGQYSQYGAGVQEQVVGDEGRADERQDGQQRAGRDAGNQDPGNQVAEVRGGEHRNCAEHEAHQSDQSHQRVLDRLISPGHQHPGGQPADADRQRRRREPRQQVQAQRRSEQVAGLKRGGAHQDRPRDETERPHLEPPVGKAVADGFREPAPAGEAHAGCHVLEDTGGSNREQDGPQERHAVACPGAAGGNEGSGTDERRGDQQARSESQPGHLRFLHSSPSIRNADHRQRSSCQTRTRSISRRLATSMSFCRWGRVVAPDSTS